MLRIIGALMGFLVMVCLGFASMNGSLNVLIFYLSPALWMVTGGTALALVVLLPANRRQAALFPERQPSQAGQGRQVWVLAERLSWMAGPLGILLYLFFAAGFIDQPPSVVVSKLAGCLAPLMLGLVQVIFCRLMRSHCEHIMEGCAPNA